MFKDKGNPLVFLSARSAERAGNFQERSGTKPEYRICLEGSAGDWGRRNYIPAIRSSREERPQISAIYRDINPLLEPDDLAAWEQFELKAHPCVSTCLPSDLLIVSTPDTTHVDVLRSHAGNYGVAIVEKPFCTSAAEMKKLPDQSFLGGKNWGVDHYPYYIAGAAREGAEIWDHLGGTCREIRFALFQRHPIELQRLPSLQLGMGFDMLSHFFAMLIALGVHGNCSDMAVSSAHQHELPEGFSFLGETALEVDFSIGDPNQPNFVRCKAAAGKGMHADVKYIDLIGVDNATVRLDMGSRYPSAQSHYSNHIIYLAPSAKRDFKPWEYFEGVDEEDLLKLGPVLQTERPYRHIIGQLVDGVLQPEIASCLLSLDECRWVVDMLDAMARSLGRYKEARGGHWLPQRIGSVSWEGS